MKNTEIKAHRVGSKAYQKELFRLFDEFDRLKAEEWFQKAKKHGNDLACLRLSYIYTSLEDEEESISCLRRAKWHGSKLAAAMLKEMEKHPFKYPEA